MFVKLLTNINYKNNIEKWVLLYVSYLNFIFLKRLIIMNKTLVSLLAVVVVGLALVGCDKAPDPAPAPVVKKIAPVAVVAPAPVVEVVGGYEPTAAERVPGISLDKAALDALQPAPYVAPTDEAPVQP